MKKASRSPAVDRAYAFLLSVVDHAQHSGRSRLPTVRAMGKKAGVSLVTMWKAVQRLKEAGVVYSAQRGGLTLRCRNEEIFAAADGDFAETSPFARSVWATTAARMERDILNRVFAPGTTLPSSKELQARYGVSYLTLRKAIDDLVSRGAVAPRHRGFVVPALRSQRPLSRIVLLSARRFAREIEQNELSVGILGPVGIRQLEVECSKAGIFLDTYYYYQDGDHVVYCSTDGDRPVELVDDDDVLGYLWLITGTEMPLSIDVQAICDRLAGFKKPVSVFSEVAEATPSLKGDRAAEMRLFPVALDEKPAVAVARYLLHLGHRRIAYISPYHQYSWSRARFGGLDAVFAAAGYARSVELFCVKGLSDNNEYFNLAAKHGDLASLRDSIARWRKQAPPTFSQQTAPSFDYAMRVGFEMGEIEHQLQPCFEGALRDAAITAWVAANDGTACMALDFLKQRGARVPHDLSVISFDDSLSATIHQLTSYDFNLPAYLSAMLAYVLKRTAFPRRIVTIDGWIVQRRTTGPAKAKPGAGIIEESQSIVAERRALDAETAAPLEISREKPVLPARDDAAMAVSAVSNNVNHVDSADCWNGNG